MEKLTLKQIKEYVKMDLAQDITSWNFSKTLEFAKNTDYTVFAMSFGKWGMNGAIIEDENGRLYAVTARNSTLFQLV